MTSGALEKPYTSYPDFVSESLAPPSQFSCSAVDLFAGCGGLSLGFEAAGIGIVDVLIAWADTDLDTRIGEGLEQGGQQLMSFLLAALRQSAGYEQGVGTVGEGRIDDSLDDFRRLQEECGGEAA